MRKLTATALIIIISALAATGCFRSETQQQGKSEEMTFTLYYSNKDVSGMITEKRTVTLPDGKHPIAVAVEELGKEPADPEGLVVLPLDTKVLGVTAADKTITIDFNEKIRDNFYGGAMSEALLLSTIIHTVTEFEGYEDHNVQILVNGKTVETIGGHMGVDEPLSRN